MQHPPSRKARQTHCHRHDRTPRRPTSGMRVRVIKRRPTRSRASSDAVDPAVAVVCVGVNNGYGHPNLGISPG
jgi:hypothetical protein